MKQKGLKAIRIAAGCIPLACVAALLVWRIHSGGSITAADILSYTPSQPFLAALVLIGFFICKSLSLFFPISVLCIAAGLLFPPLTAMLVVLIGIGCGSSLMYWMGHLMGSDVTRRVFAKYPSARQLQQFQDRSPFLFVFAVRVMGILPCDIVSLYMGATGVAFWSYLAGCISGFFPVVALELVIGRSMRDPTSPVFLLSVGLRLLLTVFSLLLCRKKFHTQGND